MYIEAKIAQLAGKMGPPDSLPEYIQSKEAAAFLERGRRTNHCCFVNMLRDCIRSINKFLESIRQWWNKKEAPLVISTPVEVVRDFSPPISVLIPKTVTIPSPSPPVQQIFEYEI